MAFDKYLWKSWLPTGYTKPLDQLEQSGILLVDKPEGITSMDLIRFFKVIGGIKKAGHAGTLDPLATGLMIVLINKATRLSMKLMDGTKEYTGKMVFGQEYDTQDTTGTPVGPRLDVPPPSAGTLNRLALELTGEIDQIPPVFSAIKKGGKPLYEYARKSKEIIIESRRVKVHKFQITGINPDGSADFYVHCDKGVYVRTLVHDLGKLGGVPAAMSALRRISIGNFQIERAQTLDKFQNADDIIKHLIFPEEAYLE